MSDRDQWLARQLLPPQRGVTIHDVLLRAGWMHSAGGTGPYLAIRARIPGTPRREVDAAAFKRFEILEVPAVRDSVMIVPREDAAVALAAGRRSFGDRLRKLEKSCGVTRKELDTLSDRILKILGDGVRTPDGLRAELPPKYIRDLGAVGKQLGLGTTLPVALRILQSEGAVIRLPEELQLNGKRHSYRLWPDKVRVGDPPADLDRALAERFAAWASPATAEGFAEWAGIGKTAARKVFQPAGPIAAHGGRGTFFLPFRDNYFGLHVELDSPHHNTIMRDGELAGIWEYDVEEQRVVSKTFARIDVTDVAAETERFIQDELGDHKFYALDHTKGRAERLQSVKTT